MTNITRNSLKAWFEIHVPEQFDGSVDVEVRVSQFKDKTHFVVAIPNNLFAKRPVQKTSEK